MITDNNLKSGEYYIILRINDVNALRVFAIAKYVSPNNKVSNRWVLYTELGNVYGLASDRFDNFNLYNIESSLYHFKCDMIYIHIPEHYVELYNHIFGNWVEQYAN
jgi:hypothetical protein